MGDPKFSRRRYDTPKHPWEGERIKEEADLLRKYGLKNKTELWKAKSILGRYRQRARILQAQVRYGDIQAEKEKKELLASISKLGLLSENATLDDVLGLDVETILNRRLQTFTVRKGLAYSGHMARQMIVHGHISIAGKKVTIPSYLVKRAEEEQIAYTPSSPLTNDLHPARPKQEVLDHLAQVRAVEERTRTKEA